MYKFYNNKKSEHVKMHDNVTNSTADDIFSCIFCEIGKRAWTNSSHKSVLHDEKWEIKKIQDSIPITPHSAIAYIHSQKMILGIIVFCAIFNTNMET